MRQKIFLSYSHRDMEYAERFHRQLVAYDVPAERIFWDRADNGIQPSQEWLERIEDEIAETRVALFLVSEHFRESRFIRNMEMPSILRERQKDPRLKIVWVRLREIDEPEEFSDLQGFCKDTSLAALDDEKRSKTIDDITKHVRAMLDVDVGFHDEFFNRVKSLAREDFGLRISREIAKGRHSMVYLAEGLGHRRVLKARMAKVFEAHEPLDAPELQAYLDRVDDLEHPAFIRFHGSVIRDDLRLLVSDYLPRARPLQEILDRSRKTAPLAVDRIRLTIGTLAEALAEYHALGLVYGNIRPSDVMIEIPSEGAWQVRLPAIRIARIMSMRVSTLGSFPMNPEIMSSLAPEQHDVLGCSEKTDQYALGLLAVELLEGTAPVDVKSLNDLQKKEAFFAAPADHGSWAERSPRLRDILLRMLSREPADRYATMADVVAALDAGSNVLEDNRRIAKASYLALRQRDDWLRFLGEFYLILFARRPDLEKLFARVLGDDAHFAKLDQAVLYLLNFRRADMACEPTTLTRIRDLHAPLGLHAKDFDDFAEAFLAALQAFGEISEETQTAWTRTIDPGLTYMKGCCTGSQAAPSWHDLN
ncbi:MAG: TIR domain-containing protein [Woeseiaceae bacterium]|jgi:serine/threonine protein kinase|nr:TIR domain-containing protein [Woeseiaceae bacterium]